ncbi:hypothetical protein D3C72_1649780 [compost metagenome]
MLRGRKRDRIVSLVEMGEPKPWQTRMRGVRSDCTAIRSTESYLECLRQSRLNCQATEYLPELFYSEGYARSESEQRLADSAFQFAVDYNLATFGNRRTELLERCPEATLLEGQS